LWRAAHRAKHLIPEPTRRHTLRIAAITSFDFHRALDGRSWNPAWRWHERRVPLLRVQAADGTFGIGEGWSHNNDTAPFHARLAHLAPCLVGTAASAVPAIDAMAGDHWAAAAAASAIDMALWDLRARARGVALHALIGPSQRAVPVYASGGLYRDAETRADLAREMRGYIDQGFRAVKLKIGARGHADDLARAAAVRAAVGPDTPIIVDALGLLPPTQAAAQIDGLAAVGVTAIQAPLPVDDIAGLAALQSHGELTVIAGETTFQPLVLRALLGAVGMLQLCPALCGGITGVLRWAAAAREAGIGITLQCHGTAVLQAACLHLGAGCDAVASVEYHMFHRHLHAALPAGMQRIINGCVRLDERLGLGIDDAAFAAGGNGTLTRVTTTN
jgi:L-alanine-DL-glutamate epimerase-like enolase superfamily enzyme